MDDKLGRDILTQLRRLAKAQERMADALEAANAADLLEAANAADLLAMIQEALGGREDATGAQNESEGQGEAIAAYVASLR